MKIKDSLRSRYSEPERTRFASDAIKETEGLFRSAGLIAGMNDERRKRKETGRLFRNFSKRYSRGGQMDRECKRLFGEDRGLFAHMHNGNSLSGYIRDSFPDDVKEIDSGTGHFVKFAEFDYERLMSAWLYSIALMFAKHGIVDLFQALASLPIVLYRHFDILSIPDFNSVALYAARCLTDMDISALQPSIDEIRGYDDETGPAAYSRYDCKSSGVTRDECVFELARLPKMKAYASVAGRHNISVRQARRIFRFYGL